MPFSLSAVRSLCLQCFVVLAVPLACLTCHGQETPPDAPPATLPATPIVASNGPTTDSIDAELAALELKSELDAATKTRLVSMLQQAKKTLQQGQTYEELANQYSQMIGSVAARQAELQAKLDALSGAEPTLAEGLTLADATQSLATLKAELATASKQVTDLTAESTRRRTRLGEIPGLLSDAEKERADVAGQQAQPAPVNESAIESQTRKTLLAARGEELAARIEALENEQAAYTATVDLLPLERKLAEANVTQLRRQTELLQEAILEMQKDQVNATTADLKQTVASVPKSLRTLAESNVELAELQRQLIEQTATTQQNLSGVQSAMDDVKADAKSSKERIDAIGLTDALGVILRQQREEAKALRNKFRPRDDLTKKVEEYQLSTFKMEDELADINQWLDQREAVQVDWDSTEIAWGDLGLDEAEWVLKRKRRKLLEDTLHSQNSVLQSMLTSDTQRRELILLIDEFTAAIDANLFWTKDAPTISIGELAVAPELIQWVSAPASWVGVVHQMVLTVTLEPLASLGLILLTFAVLFGRGRARAAIKHEGEEATKVNVGFMSTVRAMVATFVTAMVWPACLGTFAFLLVKTSPADPFVRGLGNALAMVALYVSSRELLSKVCRDKGVAECHFGWSEKLRRHLRRHLRWYTWVGGGIVLTMGVFYEHPDAEVRIFAIRIMSTALFLVTAAFHHLMLRQKSPLHVEFVLYNPSSLFYRMRKLIWAIAVLAPIVFAFMALAGYLETTFRLGHSLQSTFLLLVVIVLGHGLLSRWLMLRRRDLARRRAMEQRDRKLKELQGSEDKAIADQVGIVLEEESAGDLEKLDEQGRQTAVVFASTLGLIGFGLIWHDLVPALAFFDDFSLGTVGTGENIESVSLLDVIYSLLCIALMVYATGVVPRVFELLVRGRTELDPGARYAISTLLRYVIIIAGSFIVMNLLSVPYNQLGWLLAAASVGLGFGLQEIVANFVSGIILLLERPVRVGDVVTIGDTTGIVSRIQMRATTVTNWDRKELVIPNKDLITEKLLNWSLTNVINRLTINIGVAYGSDPDQVRELLYQVVKNHPQVLTDPAPLINFDTFGDSSLNFVVRFFLEKLDNRIEVTHQINREIAEALAKAGITIPFPQRDVHLDINGDDAALPLSLRRGRDH
ncbi:Miniconductance mechanosensitive channel MscM precursor [Stieleria maiorica]|uniref:Miniconductance mechanosensitive channel MscM n=1 Tax=Stieleria maiorica TaxID=2795974 RepID=A0A5B9M677_9BACT|nr:mechanosensitive ion channel domain-containing protein [Stieleria maiorica]QEF96641.1 Miniconductance mechanosensitive channel MscM precursor [Stieleria maiorica]